MSSFLERKTAEPARLAQAFILGEKLAVNRERDARLRDSRVRIVDDDPVVHTCLRGPLTLTCGGHKRSCREAAGVLQAGHVPAGGT